MNRPPMINSYSLLTCGAFQKEKKEKIKIGHGDATHIYIYTHTVKKKIQYRPSQSVDSVVRRLLAKPWMRERAAAAHSLSLSLSLSRPLTSNIILTLKTSYNILITICSLPLLLFYIKRGNFLFKLQQKNNALKTFSFEYSLLFLHYLSLRFFFYLCI